MVGLGVYETLRTFVRFDRNGIQLSSNGLLYQLVTQHMTWFRHEGILLRSPLLDTGFDPIGTRGVDKQLLPGHSTVGCTEPSQGIDKADPFEVQLLMVGRWQDDQADQIVEQGEDH